MATSGTKTYSISRAEIINAALRKLGEYDQGEAPSGEEIGDAAVALNLMVKEWVTDGVDLWLRQEVTLFLQPDTQSYALGTTHATASYVETTLSAAEAAAQTVLSFTSSTGMTAADNIGIKLDDNTIHWTTISSVDSAVQVTVATALPSAAASGNNVYAYTTKAGRPVKILTAYRRDVNDFDADVRLIGETEYRRQSNKGSFGPPVEAWYNPTLTTGTLYVWPAGGNNYDKLILIAQYYPDDMTAQANEPQFPIEWGNALVWGLAAELSSEYGLTEQAQGRIWRIAQHKLDKALDYDVENASVIFAMGED